MPNLLESYGLDFFGESEDVFMGLVKYVAANGKAIKGYYGTPYLYLPAGHIEFWESTERNENDTLGISAFHTHCCGKNIWEMVVSDIDLSQKEGQKTERVLMMGRSNDDGGMLPVDIITADVLPSFLKGDRIKLQVVAPCLEVGYYASEEQYSATLPADKRGKKWLIANGSLMPLSFLANHLVGLYEEGKEYTNDHYVSFMATVKALYTGTFELNNQKEVTFIRCVAETQYGDLEFHHSYEQVPEELRDNIRVGAIISGVCILSADAAIGEYENGIVKDYEHNLQLLRYTIQKGEIERLRSVLTDHTVYETETSGNSYHGPDEITERFSYVHENHEGSYIAHRAEITETEDPELEYPVGTKCIVLADNEDENYESIVFLDTDNEGNIARIKVSIDSRYHFRIIRPERTKTLLDELEVPESVAGPIMARAKLHGFLDPETEFEQIASDPYCSEHETNARRMLDALQEDKQPDAVQAIKNLLGYLFAKAVENEINRNQDNPNHETRLTASYSPYDALRGTLYTTLDTELQEKLINDMEVAQQFGNDLFGFMEMAGKTEDNFVDTFTQAAVIVQRIGQMYALSEYIGTEGGN